MPAGSHALELERSPLPDPGRWQEIEDPEERLRRGLREVYAYYEANEAMRSSVFGDAEVHAVTREGVSEHIRPGMARLGAVLAAGFGRGRRTRLLSNWRSASIPGARWSARAVFWQVRP